MRVRSIFISDVHLGSRHAQSQALISFLDKFEDPDYIYIIGDFIDGWKLNTRWRWINDYSEVIQKIIEFISNNNTQVIYVIGNHDEFLKKFKHNFGSVELVREYKHITADGAKYLVIHGDQFDLVVKHMRWLAFIGGLGYDLLIISNSIVNWFRRKFGLRYWSLSKACKSSVKEAVKFISNFELFIVKYTKEQNCGGVICGHIHTPAMKEIEGIKYCNTGDWMETCSAIVEHIDGRLELFTDQICN